MGKYTDLYGSLSFGHFGEAYINPIISYYLADFVPGHSINIGYIDTDPITASQSINIINHMSSNVVNYPDKKMFLGIGSTSLPPISTSTSGCPSDYAIISNKYAVGESVLKNTLWYRHKLRAYAKDKPNASTGYFDGCSIIVESPDGSKLASKNLLWRVTIDSVINSSAGVYECSVWTNFQKSNYLVKYMTSAGNVGHGETLNPLPAYTQGNSADLYKYKATLNETSYSLEYKLDSQGMVSLWFPTAHQFDVKIPSYTNVKDNWYIKIGRGTILGKVNNSPRLYKNYLYSQQPFEYNEMPILKILYEEPIQISDKSIKIANTPIYCDTNHSIIVNVNGTEYRTKIVSSEDFNGIVDYDAFTGIIKLPKAIEPNAKISVTYYVWELYCQYRGYSNVYNNLMHIDFNTNYGHYTHVVANSMNMSDSNKIIYKPVSIWINPNDYNNTPPGTNVFHSFSSTDATEGCPFKPAESIKIATVSISGNIKEPIAFDGRRLGGGLKEDVYVNKDAKQFFDIGFWEGMPYQTNGVFVVDINNNTFNKEYILKIIDKYKAAGTLGLLSNRTGR